MLERVLNIEEELKIDNIITICGMPVKSIWNSQFLPKILTYRETTENQSFINKFDLLVH